MEQIIKATKNYQLRTMLREFNELKLDTRASGTAAIAEQVINGVKAEMTERGMAV